MRGGGALNTEDLFFRNCDISERIRKEGRGVTRENERVSSSGPFLSPESPNMKNFRNAQRMTITESCPSWILIESLE